MSHSAILRRQSTARRITVEAQRLAIERGYDGFTLDDLAAAVGVSRRTLFNHVAGKEEAVIGVRPEWDPDAVAAFRAGGPHGNLFDDLLHLIVDVLVTEDADRTETARFHQLLETNPAIAHTVHREIEKLCTEAVALAVERPGETDPQRARVVVLVLGALVAHAITEFVDADDDRTLVDHLQAAALTARNLLA